MLKEGEIYFNNNTSINLNLFLEEYPSIPISSEEYEEIPVEGKNGMLFINKGTYPNKVVPFNFTILSEEIEVDFDKVYEWLSQIEDNRFVFGRADRCYIVKKIIFGDLQKEFRNIGNFSVNFIFEPFKSDLEKIEHIITTDNYTFEYIGNAPAESLIKIYGNGNIQITINGETMQILNVDNYIEIDSKRMQVRNADLTSKDDDTLGDYTVFEKGTNTISYTNNVTKIIVEYTTKYK
ncbi:phage tail protein [Clostridium estertheticum]|uniref:phage tail protein n=1 Tax=Clostridium estertheticum TaxID=238834 RepID=UPI0013EED3EE|nr:phage tail protein [Clostridium estertheticum]MBZ9608628.1 phage tail protein [Clostridium estertheticum]